MPALVVFTADNAEAVSAHLIKHCGYQQSMQGFNNLEGLPGSIHWPMESDLPANALYHPERTAKEAHQEAASRLYFDGPPVRNIVVFDVNPHWYGGHSRFDNDKPAKHWEDFQKPPVSQA
jgi:hypothetical protein